ncbi:MAG: GDSL-type esterase/lipase family protein [Planctomycetota bacterium]
MPGASANPNPVRAGNPLRVLLVALCLGIVAAVVVQDWTGYVPRIFNRAHGIYRAASLTCLIVFGLLGLWCALTRARRVLLAVTAGLLALGSVELAVWGIEVVLVDRPTGTLGTFHNVDGVVLARPTATNRLGFHDDHDYAPTPPAGTTRLLFLGDSYTYGSAERREDSYCEVVEERVAAARGRPVEVMNTGVAGYSPADALALLRLLRRRDYQWDAVVFSLFAQNDFTDDIPHTYRISLGGTQQRLPDLLPLRLLHPLNSHTFRYTVILSTLLRRASAQSARPAAGAPAPPATPRPYRLHPAVLEHVAANYSPAAHPHYEGVAAALAGMAREAQAPFFVVVFPDPVRVDAATRDAVLARVDVATHDFERYERWLPGALEGYVSLDLGPRLAAGTDLYKPFDTHLNDAGNRLAGDAVADFLLQHLGRR